MGYPEHETAVCPRVMICGLRGSTGKTLVALGLISAWQARGVSVAPFKKGPDYIDPAWHSRAGTRPCRNLDNFLMSEEQIRSSVGRHGRLADLALIEGNHGLFDGVGAEATASSAELAKLLQAPVVLVVDCTKTTRTVAAMVLGCQHMDRDLRLAGVLLNRVATARQERAVRTAIQEICGLPVLGSIPRLSDLAIPERHLGLLTPAEHPEVSEPITSARQIIEAHVDLDALRVLAESAPPLTWTTGEAAPPSVAARGGVRIGVVRDSAFTFYYPENLEALKRLGATLVEINALTDFDLPPLDALYIGGGYPETHAAALAANAHFRAAVRREIEAGLPVITECGGLIYLGEAMVMNGVAHPMVGVFPVTFELSKRPLGHGYACVEVERGNPFFEVGTVLRGHEFRYSYARGARNEALCMAFRVRRGTGFDGERDGLVYKNVLASFCHFHAGGTPEWAEGLLRQARLHAERRRVLTLTGMDDGGGAELALSGSAGTRRSLVNASCEEVGIR
ncbi:MAG TPA: cobyrinate a,c-diamide synthase [Candidatus Methylomirabilis sp.]|nr:cobyrinate a,c-diamide synthase [Candidatus Methylomirabilis sp.]